jgi:hypothetical protein
MPAHLGIDQKKLMSAEGMFLGRFLGMFLGMLVQVRLIFKI